MNALERLMGLILVMMATRCSSTAFECG
ncbi:hypothetical protein ACNKHW_21795 [Shigella flexneri]